MPSDRIVDPGLLAWIEDVVDHWSRSGVSTLARERLCDELEGDLEQALMSGATVTELTCINASEFAGHVAQAHDLSTARFVVLAKISYRALTATALGGAAIGAVVALFFVYPFAYLPMRLPEFWAAMTVHVIAAAVALGFSCAAVAWRFRGDDTVRRTVGFTGPLMAVGGALSVAPTVTVAWFFDYSSAAPVVLLEVALVSVFLVVAIISARWLATRKQRPANPATTLGLHIEGQTVSPVNK